MIALPLAGVAILYGWPDEPPLPETREYIALLTPAPGPRSWFHGAYGFLEQGDVFERGRQVVMSGLSARRPAGKEGTLEDRELIQRYFDLYTATDYAYVLPPAFDLPVPPLGRILAVQRRVHARWLQADDAAMALQQLEQDLAHWRRVMAGGNTLGAKMAAVQAVERTLDVREQLIARLEPAAREAVASVAPLTDAEASMVEAIQLELGIDYVVMRDVKAFLAQPSLLRPGPIVLLPLKPRATFNRHLQNHGPILAMARREDGEWQAPLQSPPPQWPAVTWWDYAFNGQGLWLMRQLDATVKFAPYLQSMRTLEQRLRRPPPAP